LKLNKHIRKHSMKKNCLVCDRVTLIKKGENPWLIEDYEKMSWVLADNQYYRGYSILIWKHHVEQFHELSNNDIKDFSMRMITIGERIFNNLNPVRINYEILMNKDHHVHAHIIPRYSNDFDSRRPIWTQNAHKDPSFNVTPEGVEKIRKELFPNG
jgi:diadenosine tetraphosphate (Ap4A) HIT family hydrolase